MEIKELKQHCGYKMAFIRQQASLAHEYKTSFVSGQLQIENFL
jgi:hypothetical protein